jgi:hypothetical protein
MLQDSLNSRDAIKGHIRIYREDTGEVYYDQPNIIVNTVKSLFARLMANSQEPLFGVWGLAVGAGSPAWPPDAQPDATVVQTALFAEVLRKQCSFIRFVDSQLNPVQGFTEIVDFQTVLNATLDNITVPIREMGLVGGGTHAVGQTPATRMSDASFWDPAICNASSATLINYKTMPPLALPPGINFIVSWILRF